MRYNFTTKLFSIFILSFVLLSGSCSKDNTKDCELKNNNPYDIWIDGTYKDRLAAKTFEDYDLTVGTHSFRYKQVSGYALYPTEGTVNISIVQCGSAQHTFP
jgi:hypothetical protein